MTRMIVEREGRNEMRVALRNKSRTNVLRSSAKLLSNSASDSSERCSSAR